MLLKEDKIKQEINNLEQDYKKIILEYCNLKKKEKELKEELSLKMETIEKLWKGDKTQKVDNLVVTFVGKFERLDSKYKEAFMLALTKVNAATRNVLEVCLEETKSVTNVKANLRIKEGIWDKIKDSNFVKAIKNFFLKLKNVLNKRDNEIDKFLKFSNISNINENKKYKLSYLIKLLETTTGKKVVLENKNEDDDKYVFEIKKIMKKVGLKPQDINKDKNYPNSYLCEYKSIGIFDIKTFINMQKLLGCNITFKPKNNNITYIWFNF